MHDLKPGDRVRKKGNPSRVGVLSNLTSGPASRTRLLVVFPDCEEFILADSLEVAESAGAVDPYDTILKGRFGRVHDLRGAITYFRLSGKLANLIYSLNTTNTKFLPYQFKPVLQFLDSPSNGLLIADEVGLGKTIEAGLIWTELKARQDAKRLLVVCPAMLREKWKQELSNRFGVSAQIVDASELLKEMEDAKNNSHYSFALVASIQGLRPPSNWDDEQSSQSGAARLARFLDAATLEDPLLDLLVVDEAHYLRNPDTQTHKLATLLRPVSLNMVMLSATPIQLKSSDLYQLLHLLDEDAFPYVNSFDFVLKMNEPVVRLRDQVRGGLINQAEFIEEIKEIQKNSFYRSSQQIERLISNPPTPNELTSAKGRANLADQLDRLNPLAKVVSRTLKRDVHEDRVQREPRVIRAQMSQQERFFYDAVTAKVREYCAMMDVSEGFMLTIPQRQLSSSMAAACEGWQKRLAELNQQEDENSIYELDADVEVNLSKKPRKNIGELLRELISIANEHGDAASLRNHDSKYEEFRCSLKQYWKLYPGKKVVLFSFYKNTLHYLSERLLADGIFSVILHGGLDKMEALKNFENSTGPNILLSSEVASEGVDLQFSSLLINYDLPWNPAKIEQRIGRIDRIGQEETKILIWNFVYEDTVDDRVCMRLLQRLNIFERALGSMEAILGDEIRSLTFELLSHKLSPEQEQAKIDKSAVAIENVHRLQQELEAEATNLIAHGDFIQNKVKAADELGRFIRGEDLFAYVKDFVEGNFSGSRLLSDPKFPERFKLEFSIDLRVAFAEFLKDNFLQSSTNLLSPNPSVLLFQNLQGKANFGLERVTQDHPLVRFITEILKKSGGVSSYFPVAACQIKSSHLAFKKGIYVYSVARWSLTGSRDFERLEYAVKRVDCNELIDGDIAELLVNTAAIKGSDWISAAGEVDLELIATLQDKCRAELEESFYEFRDSYQREDIDRIEQMIRSLEVHLERKKLNISNRINSITQTHDQKRMRILPALLGQIKKEEIKVDQRIAELKLREKLRSDERLVSSGVILVN